MFYHNQGNVQLTLLPGIYRVSPNNHLKISYYMNMVLKSLTIQFLRVMNQKMFVLHFVLLLLFLF